MAFPNRYAGVCKGCGQMVEVSKPPVVNGYTFLENGEWVNRCLKCAGDQPQLPTAAAPPVSLRVRILPDPSKDGQVHVRPVSWLGEMKFADFKLACKSGGAVYSIDPSTDKPVHRAPATAVPHLVNYLKQAGLDVELDPTIAGALQAQAMAAREAAQVADERIQRINTELATRGEALLPYQGPGVLALAEHVPGGFLLADEMGLGKGHPAGTPILTPHGWEEIQDLSVGSSVIGSDGRPVLVTGVFDRGELPIFRVTFSDQSSILCDGDHLWRVTTANDRLRGSVGRVLDTKGLASCKLNACYQIPLVAPVEFAARPVLLDAYVLGVLLGDGNLTGNQPTFTKNDASVAQLVAERLPTGSTMVKRDDEPRATTYAISGETTAFNGNPVTAALRYYNLWGCDSYTKRVPADYLYNVPAVRLALLQGLMDTDGSVSADGHLEFSSASEQMSRSVVFLVRSFGGTARLKARKTWFTVDGQRRQGAMSYRVSISLSMNPFLSPTKADRFKPRTKYPPSRTVRSVEPAGLAHVFCISVDAPDRLYVADQFIVTHNTVQALLALLENAPCVVYCPASVVGEWFAAIRRWLPGRDVTSYEGRHGMNRWPKPGQLIVASYECLPEALAPADAPPGIIAIVDEAHNFKGRSTKRTKRWNVVRDAVLGAQGAVWVLTGTPLVNTDLDELWTVLQMGRLGEREFVSKRKFIALARSDPAEFGNRLKNVMLRRRKVEVLKDLPPIIRSSVPVTITSADRAALDDALGQMVELAVIRAKELAAAEGRDVQEAEAQARHNIYAAIDLVFDGTVRPPFELIARVKTILALAKIEYSLAKLDELEATTPRSADGLFDSPILFFSAHLEPVRQAARRPGWRSITGDTPTADRTRYVKEFQDGKLAGLAMTIRAGGLGLNLTRADRIVRNDREWTNAANEQADARAWRFGQDQPVQVFDVTADHALDTRILELLAEKERVNAQTVEQAVTAQNEARESLAAKLEATLDNTTGVTADLSGPRIAPRDDRDRAALGWARTSQREFHRSLMRQFDKHGSLTGKQWTSLLQEHAAALAAGAPTTAKGPVQAWVRRGLRLLARTERAPGIDGPTRVDAEKIRGLAARVEQGLTKDEWELTRRMLLKYHRQIGRCPE